MKLKNYWLLNILDRIFLPFLYVQNWGQTYTTRSMNATIRYKMRVNSSDIIALWETWKLGVYNKLTIKNSFTIIDIGAHIGSFSIYATQTAPKSIVYAYEPSKENFALLCENIKINKLRNIAPYNVAVSSTSGNVTFYVEKNGALNSLVYNHKNHGKPQQTLCTTLSTIVKQHNLKHIDIVKIDAEGAEFNILMTTPQEVLKKIQTIICEYHEIHGLPSLLALKYFLVQHGFHVEIFGSRLQKWFFGTGYLMATRPVEKIKVV